MALIQQIIRKWSDRFIWFRGVIAAVAVLAATSQSTPFSRYEFLRLTHAFLTLWNDCLDVAGRYIDRIPLMPELSVPELNSLIIISSLLFPFLFADHRGMIRFIRSRIAESQLPEIPANLRRVLLWNTLTGVLMMASWFAFLSYILAFSDEPYFLIFIVIILALLFYRPIKREFPTYISGILFVFAFIATYEIMYFLHLPVFYSLANEFSCSVLKIPASEC